MTITVPDDWDLKFRLFDQAEAVLYQRWQSREGVSPAMITRTFAAFAAIQSTARDPAFRVWAGIRGVTQSADWFDRWQRYASQQTEPHPGEVLPALIDNLEGELQA
jgi:hypothetical protein